MIGELIYTSAPAGLRPGTSGFCTVAATKGLSKRDQLSLEALSGYEFAFGLSDARAQSNPTCFLHTTLSGPSGTPHVISRIGFAGADHTGRTNKIAHHIMVESDQGHAGPASLMEQLVREQRWATRWEGAPREMERGSLPEVDASARPANAWKQRTGDAGWGGVLARAFRTRPAVPAFVVFEPGTDVLALFQESLAVLPVEERWRVAFATYYTAALPPDRPCHWRGVLAGSQAATMSGRHADAVIIDLTKPLPALEDDEFTQAARRGEPVRTPVTLATPSQSNPKKGEKRGTQLAGAGRPIVFELQPELEALGHRAGRLESIDGSIPNERNQGGVPAWLYFAVATFLALMIALVPIMSSSSRVPPTASKGTSSVPPHVTSSPPSQLTTQAPPLPLPVVPTTAIPSPVTSAVPLTSEAPSTTTSLEPVEPVRPAADPTITGVTTGQPTRLRLRADSNTLGAVGVVSTAMVVSSSRAGQSWAWRFTPPEGTSELEAIHGRVGRYATNVSHGDAALKLTTIGSGTLGIVSVETAGAEMVVRLTMGDYGNPEDRSAILGALVLEFATDRSPHPFLLPVRALPETRRVSAGFVLGNELKDLPSLTYDAPPAVSLRGLGLEVVGFPKARILVVRQDARECVELEPKLQQVADLRFTVRPGEGDDYVVEIEERAFKAVRDIRDWLPGRQRDLQAAARELRTIQAELENADLAQLLAKQLQPGPGRSYDDVRAARKSAEKRAEKAQRNYADNENRIRAFDRWIAEVKHLREALTDTEVWIIDPWGLPLDRIRIEWSSGWVAEYLPASQGEGQ